MGKLMLEYLDTIKVKGRMYYYYRRDGKRIKLPNEAGTLEFMDAYHRANASFEGKDAAQHMIGSIASLIVAYKNSTNYKQLKPRVKSLYLSVLDPFQDKYGHLSAKGVTRNFILTWRDKMSETPAKANNSITAVKAVFFFAEDRGIVLHNPTNKIKKLKVGEWRPWTFEEIDQFYTVASNDMKLALDLALYTGQRQGDVLTMHWNHIRDGGISVVQEKGGKRLWIPMHTKLKDRAELTAKVSVIILTSVTKQPFKKRNLSETFKETCRKAKLPEDCVFHGLRKTACVRLAEAGCSDKEIQAITGQSLKMIEHYTKMANQKKMALSAMAKLEFSTT